MTDLQKRLCELYDAIGLKTDSGFSRAEIDAFCVGIEMVKSQLDSLYTLILAPTQRKGNYLKYDELLGYIVAHSSGEGKKNMIKNHYAGTWGMITSEQFDSAYKIAVGSDLGEYTISNGVFIAGSVDKKAMQGFGEFIRNYIPVCLDVRCSGTGKTFLNWNYWMQCWNVYDSFKLPFDVIDSLEDN